MKIGKYYFCLLKYNENNRYFVSENNKISNIMSKSKIKTVEEPSSRYRFFTWVVLFLALAQLVVGLDYITVWPGAEAQQIWQSTGAEGGAYLSSLLFSVLPETSPYWLFLFRLPSVLLYLLSAILFYQWGKDLFGKESIELALIVLGGSLFLPIMAKMASLDIWSLFFELATWLSLVHFQKDGTKKWLLRIALFGSLAVLFGQFQSLILMLIWQVGYYRLIPASNEVIKKNLAQPFVIIYLVFGISYILGNRGTESAYYFKIFNLSHHQFLLFSILGLGPFIGFCMASLRDLFYKLKKNEELAKLLLIALVGSFLVQSLVFPFLLVFMTARQLHHYFFTPNYPWQNWVKTWQVLHLVVVFVGVILALIGGFTAFEIDGFRAVLGCSAAYWMFSFMAVVGLYGKQRDYVIGGMTLAGVVALLFFWVQVYPFLNLKRNWPNRMVIKIEKLDQKPTQIKVDETSLQSGVYLHRAGFNVAFDEGEKPDAFFIREMVEADSNGVFLVKEQGWKGLWKEGVWVGINMEEN